MSAGELSRAGILAAARAAGREVLLEWEAFSIVRGLDIGVPDRMWVRGAGQAATDTFFLFLGA